ncbi:MSC_0622 family F1-like ATPase gamma subunit [Metamycoplasma equirhinis]|uniref:F0F1 ATP synthase subunit gamma n=1 Tax=Metamycoplasma equirhinis TaxID=92402 RepID=A0ABZ0P9X3_9BACT|nr:F0F1 ATP synthase subunit gamma [Metamycoplasma equirhinis]TPD98766.1 hypothetical protein FJM08_01750 [Metamycoplasma equirhinis]WPB53743.1 F0F1 ATP synthase subunit gamma [Metamycoplasma equirhinis]BDX52755.1 hypothetical protein JPM7_3620 [Metamycoplasma equirhinis]
MYLKTLEKKKTNLNNIRLKINSDRNILLITIMKLTKKLSFYINNAVLNKNLISSLDKKYDLNNTIIGDDAKFLEKPISKLDKIKNLFKKPKQLWIYLTEEQKYTTDSYSRYEKKILEMTKKANADFIPIGQKAIEFCKKNKFKSLMNFTNKNLDPDFASKLVQAIKALYAGQNYEEVYFVINTNKSYNEPFQILPIKNFNLTKLANIDEEKNITDFTNFKIYPNIEDFIDAQINIFLENSIHSLIIESSFYSAKTDLVFTNKSIRQLEDTITKLDKKLHLLKQEKEIEEIVMLTRKAKTDLDINGGDDEF